jgi:hypothetical protein
MTIASVDALAAPTDATTSRSEYRAALKAIDQKDWATAQKILLGLWRQAHTYDVAASLGQIEYYRKNYAASARYIAYALANLPPKEGQATADRLKTALEELKPHVGTAQISVNEPSAEIRINGEQIGVSPLAADVFLDPGPAEIEARLGADRVAIQTVTVNAGGAYQVILTIPPETLPPTPVAPLPVAEPVSPPAPAPQEPTQQHPSSKSMVPVYIGAGITTVGLGMAIGFGIAAKNAEDEANGYKSSLGTDGCASGTASASDCKAASDAYDRQRRAATLTQVGLGVSIAGAVATLAYVILWPSGAKKDSALSNVPRPTVAVDRSSGALVVTGQF